MTYEIIIMASRQFLLCLAKDGNLVKNINFLEPWNQLSAHKARHSLDGLSVSISPKLSAVAIQSPLLSQKANMHGQGCPEFLIVSFFGRKHNRLHS